VRANPYDVEAQRVLEAAAQEQRVRENMEMAMEHMPESFARVFMLYIPARINGFAVKVFVDSGAQSTIISKRFAEQCDLLRLVDSQFAGEAVGVGRAKILGRVHMAPLEIAGHYFPCTFTVLDSNDLECLFGLDMLRRYQCCIDLHANVLRLRLGGLSTEVAFLGEAELPKDALGSDRSKEAPGSQGVQGASGEAQGMEVDAAEPKAETKAAAGAPASSVLSTSLEAANAPSVPAASAVAPAPDAPVDNAVRYASELETLVSMGFERGAAVDALGMCNGSLDMAVSLLSDLMH
jgi:DNA damage-inducible protein 1